MSCLSPVITHDILMISHCNVICDYTLLYVSTVVKHHENNNSGDVSVSSVRVWFENRQALFSSAVK